MGTTEGFLISSMVTYPLRRDENDYHSGINATDVMPVQTVTKWVPYNIEQRDKTC